METEWIKIDEAARILGLSTSGIFYRKSIGLLETRTERYGSYQWLLFRRSQCEEQAANPPLHYRRTARTLETLGRWSEIEIAQLATFIDCEGCIAIHRNTTARGTVNHNLRLQVSNTYYPLILGLQQRFGGNIQIQEHSEKHPKWKPHYKWWTGAGRALVLLELAEPYFVIKAEEVAVAIAFQRRINDYAASRPWRAAVDPEEIRWRQEQMERLSALKHRVIDHRESSHASEQSRSIDIELRKAQNP